MSDTTIPSVVVVPVVSAWYSKINWTQYIAVAVAMLSYFGISVPAEVQTAILAVIIAITAAVTVIIRIYFTASVTPSSVVNK